MTLRWDDYVFAIGGERSAQELLSAASSSDHRSAFVLGVGFDPRCLVGLVAFLEATEGLNPLVIRIELPPPSESAQPATVALADQHDRLFDELTSNVEVRTIAFPTVTDAASAGTTVARSLMRADQLDAVRHLVVDVSSLPTSLYFPLLKAAVAAHDLASDSPNRFDGEIQVLACENPAIDRAITTLGVESATYVGGFRSLDVDSGDGTGTTVWAPVIGENSGAALYAVHAHLEPDDVCPVLPFPAMDPRRADALVLENQRALFEAFQVRSSDLLHADERNPFDLYRALCNLERDYKAALEPLRPTTVALSSHSSKLLSLGVLLAAIERNMPILTAEGQDYEIDEHLDVESTATSNQLCCLWLTGEPYG